MDLFESQQKSSLEVVPVQVIPSHGVNGLSLCSGLDYRTSRLYSAFQLYYTPIFQINKQILILTESDGATPFALMFLNVLPLEVL